MAEFSTGDELERNTIHAITEARWLGPIFENMSEVASAAVTMNLGPDQEKEASVLRSCGQPVLLSNLVLEENSGRSHPAHT
jgi:hypothetical protein